MKTACIKYKFKGCQLKIKSCQSEELYSSCPVNVHLITGDDVYRKAELTVEDKQSCRSLSSSVKEFSQLTAQSGKC